MSPTRWRSGSGSQFDGATAPQKTSETPFSAIAAAMFSQVA